MQIECPYCGKRDETEFSYGGEAHIVRPGLDAEDATWVHYLYFRTNFKGVHAERWRHSRGCGQWFNALRDTSTHRFWAIYGLTDTQPNSVSGTLWPVSLGIDHHRSADSPPSSLADECPPSIPGARR